MTAFLAPNPYQAFVTRNGNFQADGNGLIANVPAGYAATDLQADGCIPLSYNPMANPRNLIDAGDFTINPWQRNCSGLATSNALTTPITSTTTPGYFPDRFFAIGSGSSPSVNMLQLADTTILGFSTSCQVYRTSGNANTSPIYFGQVLESADSIRAQGETVTLSFWARAAAGYTGGSLSVALIESTGTNQSAASLIAGAWTNQAQLTLTPAASNGVAGAPATQPITSTMTRYSFSTVVPATLAALPVTQLAALISWTPTGTAGANDGVIFNGVQLEIGALSPFEHEDVAVVLEECQRYAWLTPEPAAGVVVGAGMNTGAAAQIFYMATPVQFFKAPTVTIGTTGPTWKTNQAGAATAATLTPGTTHTPNAISIAGNSAGTSGQSTLLQGGGGTGYILASADF